MSRGFAHVAPHQRLKPSHAATATELSQHLQSYFSEIQEPRVGRTRAHLLQDILLISVLAVIAGAKGWEDIETYGLSKQAWWEQFLSLPNGIPCADT
jgi:hypothetical protein